MTSRKFYLAPLRGITDRIFRAVYERHFGRFDFALAPFVPTIRGSRVKDYHIRDLLPYGDSDAGNSGGNRLIPQIIGNDSGGFLLLARRFAQMGFTSVNWNLGCPAPLITRKTRGCGLLPHKDVIARFLDDAVPRLPIPLSIKARLGLDCNGELETLIPLFNDYPLKELIIHPRTGAQQYGGAVDTGKFETCLRASKHPVVYNGDIRAAADFRALSARFPDTAGWMIGRGVVTRPPLLNELRGEDCGSTRAFLNDLLDANINCAPPQKALGKMKEVWGYLGQTLNDGGATAGKILRCTSIEGYKKIVDDVPFK